MSYLILTLGTFDEWLLHGLLNRRRRPLDLLMRGLTRVGDVRVVVPLTLALVFGAVPGARSAGILAAIALTTSHIAVQLLKRSVSRPRPRLPVGLPRLVDPEDRFSFPSGHAAAGLSVSLPLALALPGPAAAAVLAVGLLVGLSRCYLGVHYPGDVLVGWALACLGVAVGVALVG